MWINEPMPVTTRIITADSGSSRNVRPTLKSPDVIQVNSVSVRLRASGANETRRATAAADTRNDTIIAPHATAPAAPLLMRRPKLALIRKPTNGRSGISSSMTTVANDRETVATERQRHGEQVSLEQRNSASLCLCG